MPLPNEADPLRDLPPERLIALIHDYIRNWVAHDGVWFQLVEKRYGLDVAEQMDADAWRRFAEIEARRIMKTHGIAGGSGLEGLLAALPWRMYYLMNEYEILERTPDSFILRTNECRVHEARRRKGLPEFRCKDVGIAEQTTFARTIDPRIEVECLSCPPDPRPDPYFCEWRFSLGAAAAGSDERR